MKTENFNEFSLKLANTIKELREKKGGFKTKVRNLSNTTLWRIENNSSDLKVASLYTIADALGYNLKIVFEEKAKVLDVVEVI